MTRLFARLTAILAIAAAFVAIGMLAAMVMGSSEWPSAVRSLLTIPAAADLVAPAPDALSSIVITRDWLQTASGAAHPRPRGSSPGNGPPELAVRPTKLPFAPVALPPVPPEATPAEVAFHAALRDAAQSTPNPEPPPNTDSD